MILNETIINFIQEIIKFPDFKNSTPAIQQQIQHLLFLVNLYDCCSDFDFVIEKHSKLLEDIESGDTSWDNVDFISQWQLKFVNNAKFSEELDKDNEEVNSEDIKFPIIIHDDAKKQMT